LRPVVNQDSIADILAKRLWDYARELCIPRCCFLGWEADMLLVTYSKFLEEIEIKISVSDFKADSRKVEKHKSLEAGHPLIRRFWYAVPHEIWEKVEPLVPPYAGLIIIPSDHRYRPYIKKKAPVNLKARKLFPAEEIKLLRAIYYKWWRNK